MIAIAVLMCIGSLCALIKLRGRAGRPMNEALTVGNPTEWAYFRSTHPLFLRHVPNVVALANRALAKPENPEATVDRVIHGLTKMCVEEFMEIIVLCGNGYGIGGLKLVRTLYENAVTARHLHLNPQDANLLLDYLFVSEKKILDAIERETGQPTSPELREETDREFARVKGQYEVELCPECHRRGLNYRWSKLDFVAMAERAKGLDDLVIPAYRDTLRYTHAGVGGLFARLEGDAESVSYRTAPHHEEAAHALLLANDIVLRVIAFYFEHFAIEGLDDEMSRCIEEYRRVWEPRPVSNTEGSA